jgi:hypothetical protein
MYSNAEPDLWWRLQPERRYPRYFFVPSLSSRIIMLMFTEERSDDSPTTSPSSTENENDVSEEIQFEAAGSNPATEPSGAEQRSDADGSGPAETQHEESNAPGENHGRTGLVDGVGVNTNEHEINAPPVTPRGRHRAALEQLGSSYSHPPASSHNDLLTLLSDVGENLINNVISSQTYVGSMTNGDGASLGKLVAAAGAGIVSALGIATLAWTVRGPMD